MAQGPITEFIDLSSGHQQKVPVVTPAKQDIIPSTTNPGADNVDQEAPTIHPTFPADKVSSALQYIQTDRMKYQPVNFQELLPTFTQQGKHDESPDVPQGNPVEIPGGPYMSYQQKVDSMLTPAFRSAPPGSARDLPQFKAGGVDPVTSGQKPKLPNQGLFNQGTYTKTPGWCIFGGGTILSILLILAILGGLRFALEFLLEI